MIRKNNKIFLIISLLSIILLINIGYAKFSDVKSYSNLADISNSFDIHFSNISIIQSIGVDISKVETLISQNGKSINVNVLGLEYPGSGIEFSACISNSGTLPAKINSIDVNGLDNNCEIKVQILNNINDKVLNPNDIQYINFSVQWDKNSTTMIKDIQSFNINLNYIQAI